MDIAWAFKRILPFLLIVLTIMPNAFGDVNDWAVTTESESRRECREITAKPRCETDRPLGERDVRGLFNRLKISVCEYERKKSGCDAFYEKEKTPAEARIRCDAYTLCLNNKGPTASEYFKSCVAGGLRPLKEAWELIKTVPGKTWDSSRAAYADEQKFIKECDSSIKCKREYIADIRNMASLSDDDLGRYDMHQLMEIRRLVDRGRENKRYTTPLAAPTGGPSELDEYLLQQSTERFKQLVAGAEEWWAKEKERYRCYDDQAAAELACYRFFTVADPTIAVGIAYKAVKAGALIKGLESVKAGVKNAATEFESRKAAREARQTRKGEAVIDDRRNDPIANADVDPPLARIKIAGERATFISQYLHRTPTSAAQNSEFIKAAKASGERKGFYFSVENSKLRMLNNTVHDKDMITSLNNLYMEIFERRVKDLKKKYPQLKLDFAKSDTNSLLTASDYKILRYGFDGKPPPGFEKEFEGIYRAANGEFAERVKLAKLLRDEDPDPKTWFKAGAGRSADDADFGARFARKDEYGNSVYHFDDPEVTKHYQVAFVSAQELRKMLERSLSKTELMETVPGSNSKVLSRDAWEIVRKAKDDEDLQKKLNARFGAKIDLPTASTIRRYATSVDNFSPNLHIVQREVASLDEAVHGGFSGDFKGLGADNAQATEIGVIKSADINQAKLNVRTNEQAVTGVFNERKSEFKSTVNGTLEKRGIPMTTVCSGDDCIVLPAKALSLADKDAVVDALAKNEKVGGVRMSFVRNGVPAEARSKLGVHGETIEKYLDMDLQGKIPRDTMKKLVFGVDMDTIAIGEGRVNLIVGRRPGVNLTRTQEEQIQKSFDKALKAINGDVSKQRLPGTYRAGTVR